MDLPTQTEPMPATTSRHTPWWVRLLPLVALIVVLLTAAYFRFVGLMWGDYSYPHPDERFLVWVVADIAPVHNLAQYFNTATSTLNPANRGHAFFVYGDLPVVLTRYVTGWLFKQVGWEQILQAGRGLSALFDLLTVLLVYQIVERLAGWKVALLAGLLSAAAVLQIQQSHFFTSDTFSTFFTTLATYIGVLLVTEPDDVGRGDILTLGVLFGLAVGLAMACKINTAPVAMLLPAALIIRWLRLPPASSGAIAASSGDSPTGRGAIAGSSGANARLAAPMNTRRAWLPWLVAIAVISGVVAALVFRVGQPYAFSGPGFFNVSIDGRWLASIQELQNQSAGDVDFPPALQWAGRSHLFSLQNLVIWGLGIPLGITAWMGFALFAVRVIERLRRYGRSFAAQMAPSAAAGETATVVQVAEVGRSEALPPPGEAAIASLAAASEIVLPSTIPAHENGKAAKPAGAGIHRVDPWLRAVVVPALFKGSWPGVLLVWIWTAFYFTWQSLAWNPTMRYQLPIYPTLVVLAAWGLGNLWAHPRLDIFGAIRALFTKPEKFHHIRHHRQRLWRTGVGVAGALVLLLTLAWAFAFTRIYTRTETRVDASRWIFANVPGPVNLAGQTSGGQPWQQLLSVSEQADIRAGLPYQVQFDNQQAGALASVSLQQVHILSAGGNNLFLRARVVDLGLPGSPRLPGSPAQTEQAGQAEFALPDTGNLDKLDLPAVGLPRLEAGQRYELVLEVVQASGEPPSAGTNPVISIGGPVALNLYSKADTLAYRPTNGPLMNVMLPDGGTLREIRLPQGTQVPGGISSSASVIVKDALTGDQQVASGTIQPGTGDLIVRLDPTLPLKPGVGYLVAVAPGVPVDPNQPIQLDFLDQPAAQAVPDLVLLARPQAPLYLTFTALHAGQLSRVSVDHAVQEDAAVSGPTALTLSFYKNGNMSSPVAQAQTALDPAASKDPRGNGLTFTFDQPVTLDENSTYALSLTPQSGAVALRGSGVANESTWDMGLPFRQDNYDPFGGIYRGDLNFEMYWDDNNDKLQRFLNNLDQTDYIFMSSGRQWGTTTRVPERYPLTTEFYRQLLGCPADKDVVWCYRVAAPGMFHGNLGFDLVKVDASYPNLGPIQINDQFAEEAFTVYDHAKVMIFKKRADYSFAHDQAVLGAVDLNTVVHVTPKKAGAFKDLLLTATQAAVQQAGGTWASLFPPEGLLNRFPWLGAVAWYLFLLLLGGLIYPLVRLALPGLPDKGYPLARIAGLVLLAWLAWISGSAGVQVTRGLLAVIFAVLALAGIGAGFLQRDELRAEWRDKRGYFLRVEMVALALFTIDLLIRLGNPDLWHLYYGGEKPMDFSFFNAVMKSTVFPPYDPWFAGGYINYYYYGFVLVGMPVKLLGIAPSVAYNLVLPALFSMVGLGAFSVGWNLYVGTRKAPLFVDSEEKRNDSRLDSAVSELPNNDLPDPASMDNAPSNPESAHQRITHQRISIPFRAGLVAILALLILGNLGTVRMYWEGFQQLAVPADQMRKGTLPQHFAWFAQGVGKLVTVPDTRLPYSVGDWYWKPSRAIEPESGNEITEFPFFTFLYADLHAHLIALPVTLLVLAWALGVVLGKGCWGLRDGRWKKTSLALALVFGGLAAGALRPANTWDQYTYLTLAALALAFAQWQAGPGAGLFRSRWLNVVAPIAVLVGLALLLYYPFNVWFEQGYNSLTLWTGPKTGLNSYLVHWGLFLFVIVAWLFDETVDWMAHTPLTALRRLDGYREMLVIGVVILIVTTAALLVQGIWIALIVVPVGAWVAVLLFRPAQPEVKRFVLFMIGTALLLTLAVELVAVKGDIGRMNTVFKFYYQAWTLLSLSAAASLAWIWGKMRNWHPTWGSIWTVGLVFLVAGAALYPLTATEAKIQDRMTPTAPHTLDGMAYMAYSHLVDGQTPETSINMDLSQDYRAIHWVQDNVPGSPVIVEANTPEYRHWGTRFTIYTGLPGVVGWNWHERQQRTVTPDTWVFDRIDDIAAFYQTTDPTLAKAFLQKYHVQYVIFGQIEKAWYPGPGLDKFVQLNGKLWDRVYQDGDTAIYKVK